MPPSTPSVAEAKPPNLAVEVPKASGDEAYARNLAAYQQASAQKPAEPVTKVEYKASFPEGFPLYSPHNYILQLLKTGKAEPEDSVNLFYVMSVQMQQPHSLDRRWTLSRVYEQSSGSRERIFSLSGRSGDQPLDIARFLKMRNFIEKYMDLKRKSENAFVNARTYKLRFNMSWEGENFEASILSFSYQRESGNTTNSYIWNITLATNLIYEVKSPAINYDEIIASEQRRLGIVVAEVAAPEDGSQTKQELLEKGIRQEDGTYKQLSESARAALLAGDGSGNSTVSQALAATTGPLSAKNSSSWLDSIASASYTFNTTLLSVTQTLVSLSLEPANYYRKTVTPFISMFQTSANCAATIAGAVAGSLPAVRSAVISTIDDVKNAIGKLESAWEDLSALGTSDYWEDLFRLGGSPAFRATPGTQFITVNNVMQPVIAQPAPSGNSSGGGSGQQDAYNLAGIFLGDRGRWREIVEINRMPDPYTKPDGAPLQVGDIVLIPDVDGEPAATNSDMLFGSDLMIKDGDLVPRGNGLQVVRGQENLKQSISHRLRTVRGTNRIFPSFGLADFIGEKQTSTLSAQVWTDIQLQVSADRRINSVIRIILDEQPMVYRVDLAFQLNNKESLSASFEYTPPI